MRGGTRSTERVRKWETVIEPAEEYDGFAVSRCPVCGDIRDIRILSLQDGCASHAFGEWETETEATHGAGGMLSRSCAVCGETEYAFTPSVPYQPSELPVVCREKGETYRTFTLTNASGQELSVQLILAAYDAGGRLIATAMTLAELEASASVDLTITAENMQEAETVKAFLLDPWIWEPLCQAQLPD